VLLFLILAAIMVVTRRVDWYHPAARTPLRS
jgi:inner membrane protein involved in colicin E2 resistance